jgi:hypothetical protein
MTTVFLAPRLRLHTEITMLIWIYYVAQIVLFGAEFTQVYAQERGRGVRPAKHALRVKRNEIELPPPAGSFGKPPIATSPGP